MKIAIIGGKGYIGRHLLKAYQSRSQDVIGTHRCASKDLLPLDLKMPNLEVLPKNITHVIVASGIPKIGYCERNPKETYAINVEGTLGIAKQCIERNIFPIFFSSDYVFDGETAPFHESSPLNPLNEYGRQKKILEQEIPKVCKGRYLILRLSKVFGIEPGDQTLLDEMITHLIQGNPIKAAQDQIFTPISIADVVEGVLTLQTLGATGLYNLCGDETWNRYELAIQVARSICKEENLIHKITLEELKDGCKRPKNTAMSNAKWTSTTGFQPTSLLSCLKNLLNASIG